MVSLLGTTLEVEDSPGMVCIKTVLVVFLLFLDMVGHRNMSNRQQCHQVEMGAKVGWVQQIHPRHQENRQSFKNWSPNLQCGECSMKVLEDAVAPYEGVYHVVGRQSLY